MHIFRLKSSDISLYFDNPNMEPDLKQILYYIHNESGLGKAIYHVVMTFDSLCSVGNNTAAEPFQFLKISANLFMISNVCCFYCLSPCVYCIHVRDCFSVVLVNKA